jgi:hypothetical protein
LDVWEIANHLPYIHTMLDDFDLMRKFSVHPGKLAGFVGQLQAKYDSHSNPYHNWFHGFNVMHCAYYILASTPAGSLYNALEIFAILVAGLCHDVDHTGRTNAFEISKETDLAILYSDIAVLENHHAATAFFLLSQSNYDIFSQLSREDRKQARKIMIETILATDMSKHFPTIEELKTRFVDLDASPIGTLEDGGLKIAELIIHAADLSNPTKEYDILSRWSRAVNEEFSNQVREEEELGLPVSEFMKGAEIPKVYYKNEIGFNKFVVRPLWVCFESWLKPHITFMLEQIDDNLERFADELA